MEYLKFKKGTPGRLDELKSHFGCLSLKRFWYQNQDSTELPTSSVESGRLDVGSLLGRCAYGNVSEGRLSLFLVSDDVTFNGPNPRPPPLPTTSRDPSIKVSELQTCEIFTGFETLYVKQFPYRGGRIQKLLKVCSYIGIDLLPYSDITSRRKTGVPFVPVKDSERYVVSNAPKRSNPSLWSILSHYTSIEDTTLTFTRRGLTNTSGKTTIHVRLYVVDSEWVDRRLSAVKDYGN